MIQNTTLYFLKKYTARSCINIVHFRNIFSKRIFIGRFRVMNVRCSSNVKRGYASITFGFFHTFPGLTWPLMESLIRPRAVDYLANFRNRKTAPVFVGRFEFRHGRKPGRVFASREPIVVNLNSHFYHQNIMQWRNRRYKKQTLNNNYEWQTTRVSYIKCIKQKSNI